MVDTPPSEIMREIWRDRAAKRKAEKAAWEKRSEARLKTLGYEKVEGRAMKTVAATFSSTSPFREWESVFDSKNRAVPMIGEGFLVVADIPEAQKRLNATGEVESTKLRCFNL